MDVKTHLDALQAIDIITSQPASDVVAVTRALGVEYQEMPLPTGQSGYIEYDGAGYRIVVNSTESARRRRFTAAHELAHYLLHRDLLDDRGKLNRHTDALFDDAAKRSSSQPFSPWHEVQANRFAAELLIPEALIREDFVKHQRDIAALASRYDVSRSAMEIRLRNLSLIS